MGAVVLTGSMLLLQGLRAPGDTAILAGSIFSLLGLRGSAGVVASFSCDADVGGPEAGSLRFTCACVLTLESTA